METGTSPIQFRGLAVTSAMAAGVTSKLWGMSDIAKVLEDWEAAKGRNHSCNLPAVFGAYIRFWDDRKLLLALLAMCAIKQIASSPIIFRKSLLQYPIRIDTTIIS
jgi:hypothetical protein